ncbi:MAG: hypothetical protein AB8V25_05620, partial [Candidatus Midichloria sp.]
EKYEKQTTFSSAASCRVWIETAIGQLKVICQIQHTRHRSTNNFLANFFSGLPLSYGKIDSHLLTLN